MLRQPPPCIRSKIHQQGGCFVSVKCMAVKRLHRAAPRLLGWRTGTVRPDSAMRSTSILFLEQWLKFSIPRLWEKNNENRASHPASVCENAAGWLFEKGYIMKRDTGRQGRKVRNASMVCVMRSPPQAFTAAKPCSRSAMMSSMCSVPMERRMVFWWMPWSSSSASLS